jgi:hypothetical protein
MHNKITLLPEISSINPKVFRNKYLHSILDYQLLWQKKEKRTLKKSLNYYESLLQQQLTSTFKSYDVVAIQYNIHV